METPSFWWKAKSSNSQNLLDQLWEFDRPWNSVIQAEALEEFHAYRLEESPKQLRGFGWNIRN
jgi:hypothetical protein